MATTGTQALNYALSIMDELNSTEYSVRAIYVINSLCDELYPYSDNYTITTAGTRPIVAHISVLNDLLPIDDVLAQSVLPYGIASRLMLSDDPIQANNYEGIYQERKRDVAGRIGSEFEEIEDLYGGVEYSKFGAW